jgi:beta-glucosidase/6-phospho-beta-glucosidase/beta-galactosidase
MSQSFAREFVWGAAAASYQIEGAAFEDDKGLSTWDCPSQKRILKDSAHWYRELRASLGATLSAHARGT